MELVYLWVEEYKNIKYQGFNFSPRFECEFKDGNLTICDRKEEDCKNNEYLENFFGKNINVTAIVGENGSGKSNLLDLIYIGTSPTSDYFYIFDSGKELLIKGIDVPNEPNGIITHNKIKKTIFLSKNSIRLRCENFNRDIVLKKKELSFVYYNNMFSDIKNIESHCMIGSSDENKFNISTSYLVNNYGKHEFEMKKDTQHHYVSFENHYKLFKNKNIQNTINMLKIYDIKLPIIVPKKLYISIENTLINRLMYIEKIEYKSQEYFNNNTQFILDGLSYIEKIKLSLLINFLDYSLNSNCEYLLEKINIQNNKDINSIFEAFVQVFSIKQHKGNIQINPFIDDFYKMNQLLKVIEGWQKKIKHGSLILAFDDIDDAFVENYQKITLIGLDFFHFEWSPSLSTGQENLLFQFANFYSLILNRTKELKDNIFIFIDEGENSLHPNWQKKYIKYFVDFFNKNFTQKINLIFATHSPFILSDLPKENIIFLDKFDEKETKLKYPKLKINELKNGNCINVTKDIELKTFGANIHTLLSDGFFMNDGLMGEFAKSKINEIKKFYDENKELKKDDSNFESKKDEFERNKEYFQNIQRIIGEPFLQTIIKNYFDELEILFNGKKEFLDKEILRLQELRNESK